MISLKSLMTVAFICSTIFSFAQSDESIKQYIATYKDIAIEEEQRTGVPASIKLAQGIHETTAGTSDLVLRSNNHFGIKCKSNWTGESVSHTDDAPNECFRKYTVAAQSYRDHSDFLKTSSRYSSLFELDPMDYSGWANGLKKAGYATNPRYPQIIIKLIEDYHLQDYTLIAMNKMPVNQQPIASALTKPPVEQVKPSRPAKSYPIGEFRINDTRVVFVKAGTSALSIATQYNLPLARIFEFNDMTQVEAFSTDQLVFIQRKRKTGNNETHIVLEGETLNDIAQEEAIRMGSLLEYNQLQPNMLPAVGEQLYLKTMAPAMPRLALR